MTYLWRKHLVLKSISLVCILLLVACQQEPFYKEKLPVPEQGWYYDEPLEFRVQARDTSDIYKMELELSHSQLYRYENLYLRILTIFPDGEEREERLSVELADKTGKWAGKCKGNQCDVKVYLLDRFRFPKPGEYSFIFEQYSRQDTLQDLSSLELLIEKIPNE